jgi:hypothetical protein
LTSEQHLQGCFLDVSSELAQTFPRVFVQEAYAHVKRGTAPNFEAVKTHMVYFFSYGQHGISAHARSH